MFLLKGTDAQRKSPYAMRKRWKEGAEPQEPLDAGIQKAAGLFPPVVATSPASCLCLATDWPIFMTEQTATTAVKLMKKHDLHFKNSRFCNLQFQLPKTLFVLSAKVPMKVPDEKGG